MSDVIHIEPNDHVQGSTAARVTLIEYGDYQCPACGQAAPIVERLQEHFGEKLLFCFRNFPLEQHPEAESAAEVAEWAASRGEFWPVHGMLFRSQDELGPELYAEVAQQLGLPVESMQEALAGGQMRGRVEEDVQSGEAAGVRGTPTFFLNGRLHEGMYDYATMAGAIEGLLRD